MNLTSSKTFDLWEELQEQDLRNNNDSLLARATTTRKENHHV